MSDSDPRVQKFLMAVAERHRPDVDANLLAVLSRTPRGGRPSPRRVLGVAFALAVAAVGVALAVWAFLPRTGGGRPASVPSTGPARANGSIVFTVFSGPRYDSDIWAMDADGANARAVVTGPDSDRDPALSPDGTTIAFVRTAAIPMERRFGRSPTVRPRTKVRRGRLTGPGSRSGATAGAASTSGS